MDRKYNSDVKIVFVIILLCLLRNARCKTYKKLTTHTGYEGMGNFTSTKLPGGNLLRCLRSCDQQNCSIFSFSEDSLTCATVTSGVNYVERFFQSPGTTVYTTQEYSTFPWIFCPSSHSDWVVALYANTTVTFRVSMKRSNYSEALDQCGSSGHRLMKIDTPDKQNVVSSILSSCSNFYGLAFWIDGQQHSPGQWFYSDNSTMPLDDTDFWYPGWSPFPANPNWSCVTLSKKEHFRWKNRRCDRLYPGCICE